jgi:hypothetical protein
MGRYRVNHNGSPPDSPPVPASSSSRRRSKRVSPYRCPSIRLHNLFFNPSSCSSSLRLGSKMTILCSNPFIYQIDDFLSSNEFHYFNEICTQYDKRFVSSFTEDDANGKKVRISAVAVRTNSRCRDDESHDCVRLSQRKGPQGSSTCPSVKISSSEMSKERQQSSLVRAQQLWNLYKYSSIPTALWICLFSLT